jgi:hypothetical protein
MPLGHGQPVAHGALLETLLSCLAALQAFPITLGVAAFVWYGVALVGNFWLFFFVYYFTLAAGIAIAYFIAAISPTMVRPGDDALLRISRRT